MKRQNYDDEFKLEVIKAYLESPHGVRTVARSYGLPSKNYIERWMTELKKKRLIPMDAQKENAKSSSNSRPAKTQNTRSKRVRVSSNSKRKS